MMNRSGLIFLFILSLGFLNAEVPDSAFTKSLAESRDSAVFFKQHGNKKGEAQCYWKIGNLYLYSNHPKKALDFFRQGLALFKETNSPDAIGSCYCNMGLAYQQMGDEKRSVEYQLLAVKEFDRLGQDENSAVVYHQLAVSFINIGRLDKTVEYERKAYRLFVKCKNNWGIGASLTGFGLAFFHNHNYDSALYYFNRSIAFADKEDRGSEMYSVNYLNIGDIYNNLQNYEKAKDYYQKAYDLDIKNGDVYGSISGLGKLAWVYKNLKDYPAALKFATRELELAKEKENIYGIMNGYYNLSEINESLGRFELAYRYFKKFQGYKDSLSNTEKIKVVSDLTEKYETVEKEKEIFELNKNNEIQESELKRMRAINYAIISAFGLILMLLTFTWYYYANKRKTEKLVSEKKEVSAMLEGQEQERMRIATDLHDRLGSMLATVKLYFNTVEDNIEQLKQENREHYSKASTLLDEACSEVRKISHDLASGVLIKMGLVPALNDLKNTLTKTGRLHMDVFTFGMEARLPSDMETGIYRITQELVSNTLRHAEAQKITVQLNRSGNNLNLIVEDDGKGFEKEDPANKEGMGLKNIRERVKKMNGTLSIDSIKDRGTIVIIDMPV